MRKVLILGAGGRDFHDFNVVFRDDADTRVVAFTATQIPGIAGRRYPASLAGPLYPDGIPILPEARLEELIHSDGVDEVVLAYSDIAHEQVMHLASRVLAAGASFRLLGPAETMLDCEKPVVAVTAVRTGCGKSPTSRAIARSLGDAGLRVVLVRHPMPYGDLEAMRVQRFATLEDIDEANPTLEEREEYEQPVADGMVVYAGVDYAQVLEQAEQEADVIVWDGGNNDLPFVVPDLHVVVVDPLRPGDELAYHPGEANLRRADVVLVTKVDSADPHQVVRLVDRVTQANPTATIVYATLPTELGYGPEILGRRVLAVDDGPTLTHGGMPYGAGFVAAVRDGAAALVDARPVAVGSIADTFARFPHIGNVLPATGYSSEQLHELEQTIDAVDCDVVVTGTPVDLGRLIRTRHPIRRATYELEIVGEPTLEQVLAPLVACARGAATAA